MGGDLVKVNVILRLLVEENAKCFQGLPLIDPDVLYHGIAPGPHRMQCLTHGEFVPKISSIIYELALTCLIASILKLTH